MATSSQWGYGLQTQPVIRSIALLLLCSISLFILFKSVRSKDASSNLLIANAILLGMLTIIFLKIGTNRADLVHIHNGMWPALLAFLYAQHINENFNFVAGNKVSGRNTLPKLIGRSGLESLSFLLLFISLIAPTSLANSYNLLSSLIRPRTNEDLVSDGVKWVSSELKNVEAKCVFDLANHGVINGLTDIPACTRFTYPVYANKNYQNEIIETIKGKKPEVIIYSSTHWAFAIDNKSMHDRFPNLKDYLDSEYLNEVCKFDYCLRYLKANQHEQDKSK